MDPKWIKIFNKPKLGANRSTGADDTYIWRGKRAALTFCTGVSVGSFSIFLSANRRNTRYSMPLVLLFPCPCFVLSEQREKYPGDKFIAHHCTKTANIMLQPNISSSHPFVCSSVCTADTQQLLQRLYLQRFISLTRCYMVRLIEFSLETQFAAEDSHFQPPAFVHRGDMVLSPVTNKKNVRNAKMARRNPSPLATNSALSSLRAKAQCSIFWSY